MASVSDAVKPVHNVIPMAWNFFSVTDRFPFNTGDCN